MTGTPDVSSHPEYIAEEMQTLPVSQQLTRTLQALLFGEDWGLLGWAHCRHRAFGDVTVPKREVCSLGVSSQEGRGSAWVVAERKFRRNISTGDFSSVNLGCIIQSPHSAGR